MVGKVLAGVLVVSSFVMVTTGAGASTTTSAKSSVAQDTSLPQPSRLIPPVQLRSAVVTSVRPLGRGLAVAWVAPNDLVDRFEVSATAPDVPRSPSISVSVGSTSTIANIGNLVVGRKYIVRIRTFWRSGGSVLSSYPFAVAPVAPTAPVDFLVTATYGGNQEIKASWMAPSYDGGAPIRLYKVTASAPGLPDRSASFVPATRSATLGDLVNGVKYVVRVAAQNAVGSIAFVSKVTTTARPEPARPSSLLVIPNGNGALKLSWSKGLNPLAPSSQKYIIEVKDSRTGILQERKTTSVSSGEIMTRRLNSKRSYFVAVSAVGVNGVAARIESTPVSPSFALNRNTAILDSASLASVTLVNQKYLLLKTPLTGVFSSVHQGSVLAAGPSSTFPNGLLAKVLGGRSVGNLVAVDLGPASLADAINRLSVSDTFAMTPPPEANGNFGPRVAAPQISATGGGSISLPFDRTASLGPLTAHLAMGATISMGLNVNVSLTHASVGVSASADVNASDSISAAFSASRSFSMPTLSGSPVDFQVGPFPIEFRPTLDASFTLSADGSVSVSTAAHAHAGVNWSSDSGISMDKSVSMDPPSFSGSADLSATLDVSPGLEFYGLAGPSMTVEGEIVAAIHQTAPYVTIDATLNAWGSLSIHKSWSVFSINASVSTPHYRLWSKTLWQSSAPPTGPGWSSPSGSVSTSSGGGGSWPSSGGGGGGGGGDDGSTWTPATTCSGWGSSTPTCHIYGTSGGFLFRFAPQIGATTDGVSRIPNGGAVTLYCQVLNGDRVGFGSSSSHHWYYAISGSSGSWIADYYTDTPITGDRSAAGLPNCSSESGAPPEAPSTGAPAVPSNYVPIPTGAPPSNGGGSVNYVASPHPVFHVAYTGGLGLYRRSCPHLAAQCQVGYGPGEGQAIQLWCQVQDGDLVGAGSLASHHWYYATWNGLGTWLPDYYTDTPVDGDTLLAGVAICSVEDGGPPEANGSGAQAPVDLGNSATGHKFPVVSVTSDIGLWQRQCPHTSSDCKVTYGPGSNASMVLYCQVNDGDNVNGTSTWYFGTFAGGARWTWATAAYLTAPNIGVGTCSSEFGVPPEFLGPQPPQNVTLTPILNGLTVSWQPGPPNTSGNPTTHYVATAQPGNESCTSETGSSCTIGGLNPDTVYTVTMTDQNWIGFSGTSPPVQAQPLGVPSAPLNVALVPGLSSVQVSWSVPQSTGGTPILSYTVTAQPGGATCTNSGALTCRLTGLVGDGTFYFVSVTATNAQGSGPPSPDVKGQPWQRPSAPASVSLASRAGGLDVSWPAVTTTDGSTILKYTVVAQPGNESCTALAPATSCSIVGLKTDGTAYLVSAFSTNEVGDSQMSPSAKGYSFMAPQVPSAPVLTPGVNSLTVSWQPASGGVAWSAPAGDPSLDPTGGTPVTSYYVLAQPGGAHCEAVAPETTCTLSGLAFGTTYSVQVESLNAVGPSAPSASASGKPFDLPAAPTQVSASGGNSVLTVSWTGTPDAGNGGTPVTEYVVTAEPGGKTCTTSGESNSCTISGLANGQQYTVWVQARTAVGLSTPSDPATGNTFSLPSEPANFTATGIDGGITLTWLPPDDNGGTPITAYQVFVSDGTTSFPCLGDLSGNGSSCTVHGLTNDHTYVVTLQAKNVVGSSLISVDQAPIIPRPTAPGAPGLTVQSVSASPSPTSTSIAVGIAPPADTGGLPISNYTVVATDAKSGDVVNAWSTTAPRATLTKLNLGVTYQLQAFGSNAAGVSHGSNSATVTPMLAPGPVNSPTDTSTNRGAVVHWSPPSFDGGSPITQYVAQATVGTKRVMVSRCTWTSGPLTCIIDGLTNGVTYQVTIVAINSAGSSPATAPISVKPAPIAPLSPTIENAVPGNGTITVSLAPYDQAGNGGSPVSRFTITATPPPGNGPVTCTVTLPLTSCSLNGLRNGVSYQVASRSTNGVGLSSPWTSPVQVTPFTYATVPLNLNFAGLTATSVTLRWQTPSSQNGSPVSGYIIRVMTPGSSAPVQVVTVPSVPSLSSQISGLNPGCQYSFSVVAVNKAGPSPSAAYLQLVLPVLPAAPLRAQAVAGAGQATVTWSPPVSNGGSPITGYVVSATPDGATCKWTSGPLTCTVSGLANGTTYTFRVQSQNQNGISAASAPSNAVKPTTTPDSPEIVSVTPGNHSLTVHWSLPAFNGGLPVLGSTAQIVGDPEHHCFSQFTSCQITGLINGTHYSVQVVSANTNGNGSPAVYAQQVVPSGPPDAPSSAQASSGVGSATVTWTPPGFDEGSPITSYIVTASPNGAQCQWSTGPLACTITGLTNGTMYGFSVAAVNANGIGISLTGATATPSTAPDAPTQVSGSSNANGQSIVSWTAPAWNGGAPITGYKVTATPGGSTCSWNSGPLTCTVQGLTNGLSYTFTVVAINLKGTGSESTASGPSVPSTVPAPPSSLVATSQDSSLALTWQPPSDTGGATVSGYLMTASPGGATCSWKQGPLTCTITGLTNGTAYTVRGVAINASGQSIPSASSASSTPSTIPMSPATASAAFGNMSATVSWTPSLGDGGSPITGYLVLDSNGEKSCAGGPSATSCVVTGLTNGVTYSFTVVAVNASGGSVPTSAGSVTPSTAAGAPTSISVVAGNQQVAVSWSPPVDNGGAPITSYLVTASPGGASCTWLSGPLSCTITGLTNGVAYTLSVVAINQSGAGTSGAPPGSYTPQNTPSAPTGILVTPGVTSVLVTWSAPTAGVAVTGYVVTASPGGATCTPSPATSLSCSFTNLTPGTTYTFSVVASSAYGMGPASMPSASVLMPVVPGTPTNVSLQAGDGSLVVGWTSPSQNGGAPIESYIATAQPGGATCTSAESPCTITGLSNGTNYTVTVRALNGVGSSAASSPSSGAIPSGLPGIPNNVYQSDNSQSAIRMQWSDANNNGASITQYQAQTNTGASCIVGAGQGDTCVIPNLPAGSSFTCYVRAMNANGWGGWSGGVGCNTQNPPPPPTTNVYKGGSFYASWCTSNCRFIGFSLSNFSANTTYSVQLCDSVDGSCNPSVTGWSAITITTDGAGNFSMTTKNAFGYSGRAVWAHVVGVASNENHLTW